jgi:hypothetical protein
MRYEVVQDADEWVVCREGSELARFADQERALNDVAERLRAGDASATAKLSVRFRRPEKA